MRQKNLKILELCQFSAGICGVWARVREEALRLRKIGYEIRIFSSNAVKESSEIARSEEQIGDINVKRFNFKKLGGESFMNWDFFKEALEYSPDLIICHSYRHPHTVKALKLKEALEKQGKSCKVFLVTHAPFSRANSRSLLQNLIVYFYDLFIGRFTLNKFDKIIAITKWEIPYLERLGVKHSKIAYIPNGIPEEFFKLKSLAKEENKILFLGRIASIKNLEILIKSIALIKNRKVKLDIIGPVEKEYKNKLLRLIKEQKLEDRVIFHKAVYNLLSKIKVIDSHKIFVLPSKSEGMPQSLIEAMARSKLVIANDIPAVRDLISDGKNGYVFNGSEKDLATKIDSALNEKNIKMKKLARSSVHVFAWGKIIAKIKSII